MLMCDVGIYNLEGAYLITKPFPHFITPEILPNRIVTELLNWLEGEAPWNLVEESFYEQFEFSILDVDLPGNIGKLVTSESLEKLTKDVGSIFSTDFARNVDITAHKLAEGQSIRIHNDVLDDGPSHRLVIQINANRSVDHGGLLILFSSDDAADIARILKPVSNTAAGFEISSRSNHAVSKVHRGERYTLVYSFKKRRT